MIPHAPEIDAAYGRTVWQPVVTVTPYVGGAASGPPLAFTGGTVRSDWSRWPRTTATIELPTDVTPAATSSPVAPWGDTIGIDVGLSIMRRMFTFRAATLDVASTEISRPDGTIVIECVSHEARVNEDRYDTATPTPAGTASAIITGIVRRTMGASHPVTVNVTTDPVFAAGAFTLDGDVWPVIDAIADTAGFDVFFNHDGFLVIRDRPGKTATPAVAFTVGNGGTTTGYRSRRQWAYNRVVLVFEVGSDRADPRVVGVWEDTAPGSATRVSGPYGRHTLRETITVEPGQLPTQAVANAAAYNRAFRAAAPFRNVAFRTIPAPWVTPGDTARFVMLGGLTEDHIVAANAWPLTLLDVADVETTDSSYTGGI